MPLKTVLYVISILALFPASAQIIIKGIVAGQESKAPLSFVNIGIKNKNVGTSSQLNGSFSITLKTQHENDTLTFSLVGYTTIQVPVEHIISTQQNTFLLPLKETELTEVSIKSNALMEKKFGIKKRNPLINFIDASNNQNDIFEIAQLIRFDTSLSKVTSVNLLISSPRKDSATFRINFYRFDGNRPGERIVEKSIVQTKKIDEGWLKFDISKNNIYLKGNFIIALEFIPSLHKTDPIQYEVKLGGPAKSFVRASSQGNWTQPPHHYKMYITALVEQTEKLASKEIDEDLETIPSTTLFSKSVKDSFCVFVKLPENYNTKKRKRFKTVYILDGNAYVDVIADEIKKQKKDLILVGIGYKNAYLMDSLRNRDYTFPEAMPEDSFKTSGGAKKFLSFITSELIPYIDRTYKTDASNRTLMGHSLGGFFTLFAMEQLCISNNSPFTQYVAASPSVQYGNNYLSRELQNVEPKAGSQTLIVTVGENEMKEEPHFKESYQSFVKSIAAKGDKDLTIITELFPNYSHMDTAIPTFIKGLNMN